MKSRQSLIYFNITIIYEKKSKLTTFMGKKIIKSIHIVPFFLGLTIHLITHFLER